MSSGVIKPGFDPRLRDLGQVTQPIPIYERGTVPASRSRGEGTALDMPLGRPLLASVCPSVERGGTELGHLSNFLSSKVLWFRLFKNIGFIFKISQLPEYVCP